MQIYCLLAKKKSATSHLFLTFIMTLRNKPYRKHILKSVLYKMYCKKITGLLTNCKSFTTYGGGGLSYPPAPVGFPLITQKR